jgi:CheY-like chemotaxis protein
MSHESGLSILVAEDTKLNAMLMTEQLRLLGFSSQIATTGREALALWRTGAFAVLLTDIEMPEMDGRELARAIRAEEAGLERIPIIALTAGSGYGESPGWREAGIDAYLAKPTELSVLGETLRHWLERSRTVSE